MMCIPLNLVRLQKETQELSGEVAAVDLELDFADELIHFNHPLRYDLTAEWMDGAALVRGRVELPVDCECARCLRPFLHAVELPNYALHIPLSGEDAAPVTDDCVDLTPFLREDSLLGLPQHPLCRSDCPGLAQADPGAPPRDRSAESGTWSQLDQLKFDND